MGVRVPHPPPHSRALRAAVAFCAAAALGHVAAAAAAAPANAAPPDKVPESRILAPVSPDPNWLGTLRSLALDARVADALEHLGARDGEITDLQVRFAATPARDFRASERALILADQLRAAGLEDVRLDAIGNVIGVRPGAERGAAAVVLSAHLDTVFPELDSVHVEREGTVLRGPGVGDDAAGLAAIVAIARALQAARVPLRRDVWVVGTVGEEGEGDLRGVKHFFAAGLPPERVAAFFTLDLGSQVQIVNEGVGSRRLQVTVRGRGGHSWGDFGRANPIHALARAVNAFLETPMAMARSSYNVGVIEGGTGVNVIPESAALRLDLRSEEPEALLQMENAFRSALETGVARERAWSHDDALRVDVDVIGDRPVGRTPADTPVVQATIAAFTVQGLWPVLGTSSTDANLPMSLGVPALALPHGCQGSEAHSRREWCDVANRTPVLGAELLAVVAAAELHGPPQFRRGPTD